MHPDRNRLRLVLFSFFLVGVAAVRAADPIGLVVSLRGSAVASISEGVSRTLEVRSHIFLKDTVMTRADSKLQIMFHDDSIFAQGEKSSMTVDEYLFTPSDPKNNALGLTLGEGLFRTVTGKITDLNSERFIVKTPRATTRIRGCDVGFSILSREDRIAIITLPLNKKIIVEPMQGDQKAILETPAMVVVDNEGRLESEPLPSGTGTAFQEGTTPYDPPPYLPPPDIPPPPRIIPETVTYAFSGQGAATASIQSDAVDGLGIPYTRNDTIIGTTILEGSIGNGQHKARISGDLGDRASTHLVFDTGVHSIQPVANSAPLGIASLTLSTGGGSSMWRETDLTHNQIDLTLFYAPNSLNPPIAGQVNSAMEAWSSSAGNAVINMSTDDKINLLLK